MQTTSLTTIFETHLLLAVLATAALSVDCNHLGRRGKLDACQIVTKTDAESVLRKPVRLDKKAAAELEKQSAWPEATGSCVYTAGDAIDSPRLDTGYRNFGSVEEVKAEFDGWREHFWKNRAHESLENIGDEAVIIEGSKIVFRKSKTFFEITVQHVEPGDSSQFSVNALKDVAQRAANAIQ